jgi:hypothetical protein
VTTGIKLVAGSEEPRQSAMNTAAKATRTIAGQAEVEAGSGEQGVDTVAVAPLR